MDSSITTKETEDPKGSFTMRMGCPRAPPNEKNSSPFIIKLI